MRKALSLAQDASLNRVLLDTLSSTFHDFRRSKRNDASSPADQADQYGISSLLHQSLFRSPYSAVT